MNNKIYLVDGSGYIFRAFYAITRLSTKEGFPTNALFGFTRMLIKLLNECRSENVVMVFDAGQKTFRNDLYPEYKANRDECPEDLVKQMPFFREIAEALGLPILELPGFEADDVIGTLAERIKKIGQQAVIVSADKDLMQLVNADVSMWDTMRDLRYGEKEVEEKFGVGPDKVVELLALAGDSSDNIPGLRGVGPKTAVQLIEKYGDVEKILVSAEAIANDKSIRTRKKISEKIESEGDMLRLSRQLVEVRLDAPVKFVRGDFKVELSELSDTEFIDITKRQAVDSERLGALVKRFELDSIAKELKLNVAHKQAEKAYDYKTIYKEDFSAWLEVLKEQEEFAFDLETTSLDPFQAEIVGVAFCWAEQEAYYIPFAHDLSAKKQMSFAEFFEETKDIFLNPKIKKVGQNLKFDISVFAVKGLKVCGVAFDTMIAAYLLNSERSSVGLGALARDYLGVDVIEYEEVTGDKENFSFVDVETATKYAAEDAHISWLLALKFQELLQAEKLNRVFSEIEMPLVDVLSEMELKGVKIDAKLLSQMSDELALKLEELKQDIWELAGGEFNVNSPKQLADIMFNKLGIPTKGVKKTKTGFSTNVSVLEKLSHHYPLPKLVLDYRSLHKLKSTYVDVLPVEVSPYTGRLHSKFNQTVTSTGRLSSSDPNLQNIPIQTSEGRKVRRAFIAEEGYLLISADYSQVELRLLAHMSGDANLIKAFNDDLDIHASTAREIMNLSENDELSPELRRMGKVINFGIIYGMSGFRLGRDLGIPVGVANNYIENYFAKYPAVKEFFAGLEAQAENEGYVSTIFGRKRDIANIDYSGRDRGFVLRAAMNAPIQGSAADLVKLAMIRIFTKIKEEDLPLHMILQIHDELVFECRNDFAAEATKLICHEMENVAELSVPLKVDIGQGQNWEEAH